MKILFVNFTGLSCFGDVALKQLRQSHVLKEGQQLLHAPADWTSAEPDRLPKDWQWAELIVVRFLDRGVLGGFIQALTSAGYKGEVAYLTASPTWQEATSAYAHGVCSYGSTADNGKSLLEAVKAAGVKLRFRK